MKTLTGLLLIIVPIAFNTTFFLLQRAFEYPAILRNPTDTILRRFQQGGASLRQLWYAFTFSAVQFTPVPVLVQQVFQPAVPWYLVVGTALGVLAGAVQFLGLIRWPFLVPTLADIYTDSKSTQPTRDSAAGLLHQFVDDPVVYRDYSNGRSESALWVVGDSSRYRCIEWSV